MSECLCFCSHVTTATHSAIFICGTRLKFTYVKRNKSFSFFLFFFFGHYILLYIYLALSFFVLWKILFILLFGDFRLLLPIPFSSPVLPTSFSVASTQTPTQDSQSNQILNRGLGSCGIVILGVPRIQDPYSLTVCKAEGGFFNLSRPQLYHKQKLTTTFFFLLWHIKRTHITSWFQAVSPALDLHLVPRICNHPVSYRCETPSPS